MDIVQRLLGLLRPHKPLIVVAVFSMMVLSVATGLFSWLVGPLFLYVLQGGRLTADTVRLSLPLFGAAQLDRSLMLRLLPALIFFVAITRGVASFGQFYCMGLLSQHVVADLRARLHSKLLGLPPAFFARASSGDLLARFSSDVSAVDSAVSIAVAACLRDGMQVLVLLGISVALDWRLAALAFVAVPLMVLPVVLFVRGIKQIARRAQQQIGGLFTLVHEAIQGVPIVQAFGMERYEKRKFADQQAKFLNTMKRSLLVHGLYMPMLGLIAAVAVGATVVFAAREVAAGTLQPERVISFLATIVLLYSPLKNLGGTGQSVTQGLAGARRIFEILDEPEGLAEAPHAVEANEFLHEVRFSKVGFAYGPRDGSESKTTRVLSGVDLVLVRGEVVAIVGPSGTGKSTLLNLLPRFADPTEGSITLDGIELKALRLSSLRAQVALVAQETFLFDDTVRANIAYGLPDVGQDRLEAAARGALAHDFIMALPQGYETRVGERGTTLSGGQRQRLAIARALLKNAPILLLDEATSALDTESEREVQRALEHLMEDRTCLVIAHRLTTIRNAHRIAVLVGGSIVEIGTHDELLARNGEYARLYQMQFAQMQFGRPQRRRPGHAQPEPQ